MTVYLHKDEYVPYAPDGAGEQIHINHEKCPAGEDTKQRLYIRRLDDGLTVLAYCHHCGRGGSFNTASSANIESAKSRYRPKHSAKQKLVYRPESSSTDISGWPSRARAWLYRYGITNKEIKDYGIFYNPTNMRVGIPVFGADGIRAIQYRKIFDKPYDEGPKYYTVTGTDVPIYRSRNWSNSSTVVLCEDAISAIKCGRFLPSAALVGTYLNDKHINELVTNYDTFLIFLDDDNPAVRLQQLVLKNRLSVFGEARIIHTDKDPKEYSNEALSRILL